MITSDVKLDAVMLDQKLKTYRLSRSEYDLVCKRLGREPQGIEWALFSALWSEHCSYKSSKVYLKNLFRHNARVLESEGENAGIIDLGEGEKIAFKMESHNHPSFIEPHQGAATGVGGILRDIFTMGARPIALANYLCFGEPDAPRMTEIVRGVVAGIGGYGNCVGVPTITGQTEFHASYNENVLVNAMAVGLFGPEDPIVLSKVKAVGATVVYAGAKTGRDGVHGASMASESFDEGSESKRPTIQIGDPFLEKLLIEACLEVMKRGLVLAIQDMGAAGLTSSSFEMAAKSEHGMELDLSQVPLRDSTMSPEDILLSESQERMLMICEPRNVAEVAKVFAHWGLDACAVGRVIEQPLMRILWKGETLTEIHPGWLVDEAPQYKREWTKTPATTIGLKGEVVQHNHSSSVSSLSLDVASAFKTVEGSSRSWIYEQYDQRVQANTVQDCSHSIGVVRLPYSGRYLGVVLGCRPYVMRAHAAVGGADAVLYPALELALKGFEPLAVTDCLNFGNPEKPDVMGSFVESLNAMSEACQHLNAPIISGNVSFYNETKKKNISPTPSTGLVGLRSTGDTMGARASFELPADGFREMGERVYVIDDVQIKGSARHAHEDPQMTGELDLARAASWIQSVRLLVERAPVRATRAVGKFGIGYALARMAMCFGKGGSFDWTGLAERLSVSGWNAEVLYAGIIAVPEGEQAVFEAECERLKISTTYIGAVTGTHLKLTGGSGSGDWSISELERFSKQGWEASFEALA